MKTGTSTHTTDASVTHTTPTGGTVQTPDKGCASNGDGSVIKCNWAQMATPTCPVPGPNVAMPDNCRPQRQLIILL